MKQDVPIDINPFITQPAHERLYHTAGVFAPYSLRTAVWAFKLVTSYLSYRDRHVVIVYKNGEGELIKVYMNEKTNKQTRQTSPYDNNVKLVDAAFYQ